MGVSGPTVVYDAYSSTQYRSGRGLPQRMQEWAAHVASLGVEHAEALKRHAIALMRNDSAFRHGQILEEHQQQRGSHPGSDGRWSALRTTWAVYTKQIVAAGRERMNSLLQAQCEHEARVEALTYPELNDVAEHDPVLQQLACNIRSVRGERLTVLEKRAAAKLLSEDEVDAALEMAWAQREELQQQQAG